MKKTQLILMLLMATALVSCKKPVGYGNLSVNVGYSVNGKPLVTDSLCYHNEAGNTFMITEIQWFISKMELQNDQGERIALDKIFYIDTNIPESQTLRTDSIPVGKYKTLHFTFGLNEDDNQTGFFTDPPESEMFWPDVLGGGYHYMKLNGRFVSTEGELAPLAIHLGIGQNADHTKFYQNYFTVELPLDFTVTENAENQFDLYMIVDNWFRNPNLYDFNVYGSAIMQNQAAQQVLKENGKDVFKIMETTDNKNNTKMEKDNKLTEKFNETMQKAAPKPHFWSWESVKERIENSKIQDSKI